jgi:hypothetical protein
MRFAQIFLLALFTLLQGVAPLLHAHVAEGPHNGAGLHAPEIGSPVAMAGEAALASERQSPYVDVAEQWRRAFSDLAPPYAGVPALAISIEHDGATFAQAPDRLPLAVAHARPPAQAPPAPPA